MKGPLALIGAGALCLIPNIIILAAGVPGETDIMGYIIKAFMASPITQGNPQAQDIGNQGLFSLGLIDFVSWAVPIALILLGFYMWYERSRERPTYY